MEANLFELSNANVNVTYRAGGNGSPSTLTYRDSLQNLIFTGQDISETDLAIGTLLTVTLPDAPVPNPVPPDPFPPDPLPGGPTTGSGTAGNGNGTNRIPIDPLPPIRGGRTMFTLLLPSVNTSALGATVAVNTDAIRTMFPSKLFATGIGDSFQTYAIEALQGTALFLRSVPQSVPLNAAIVTPVKRQPPSGIRALLYDARRQWPRLAALAVPSARETANQATARKYLYYNSVLSTVYTIVLFPAKFGGVFDTLMDFVGSHHDFTGLESVFLTFWNMALIQKDSARAARASSLWRQYSQTVGSVSDIDPIIFYESSSKGLGYLPAATLRSLRANGTNAAVLMAGTPFGQKLLALAAFSTSNPFKTANGGGISPQPQPRPQPAGGAGGGRGSGGAGTIHANAATAPDTTAQDGVNAAVLLVGALGAAAAAAAFGPELVVAGVLTVVFVAGFKAGNAIAPLVDDFLMSNSDVVIDIPNGGTDLPPDFTPVFDPNGDPGFWDAGSSGGGDAGTESGGGGGGGGGGGDITGDQPPEQED